MERTGVIVAGGRSTRFGDRDKATAALEDTPMIRRVADRVASVTDELVVNCRRDQQDAIEAAVAGVDVPFRFALDRSPDEGPVAGIREGMEGASGEYAAVVACDMPFVDPDFLAYLFSRARGRDGAVPRPDEYFEVTQAVYRVGAMADACAAALEAGERKVLAPLDRIDYVVVDGDEIEEHATGDTFVNVNTREELRAAERRRP